MSRADPIRTLLIQAGLWRATLGYWVRWQASLEANWSIEEENECVNLLLEEWHKKNSGSNSEKIDKKILRDKIRVAPAVAQWSHEQWGPQLESLYLKTKSDLDKASCRLLRTKDKSIANELYFRIKARETSFEMASREFGEGPERRNGGLIPLQALGAMPFGLAPLLQQLKPGKVSQPLRLGKSYCLVELVEFQASKLDETTKKILLGEQLRLWIDSVVDVLVDEVSWTGEQKTPEET